MNVYASVSDADQAYYYRTRKLNEMTRDKRTKLRSANEVLRDKRAATQLCSHNLVCPKEMVKYGAYNKCLSHLCAFLAVSGGR